MPKKNNAPPDLPMTIYSILFLLTNIGISGGNKPTAWWQLEDKNDTSLALSLHRHLLRLREKYPRKKKTPPHPRKKKTPPLHGIENSTTSPPWRVAMVHIPKTAGTSFSHSLHSYNYHSCSSYTGGTMLCSCEDVRCRALSKVAVVEAPYPMVKAILRTVPAHWLWVAVIRRPSDWFYSAVGQWCSGRGRFTKGPKRLACIPGANHSVLRAASWFDSSTLKDRLHSGEESMGVKYYFFGANIQTSMLGGLFLEGNWLVATMEDALSTITRAIQFTALESRPFKLMHSNEAHWPLLKSWKEHVPWTSIRQYYAVDEAFYGHVKQQHGSCLAHISSKNLSLVLTKQQNLSGEFTWV